MRIKPILLVCLLTLLLAGCGIATGTGGTPQPVSPESLSSEIIRQVNAYLIDMDPVGYVLDTKFQAVDAVYDVNANNQFVKLSVSVDCQGLCSRERTFSVAIMAMRGKYGTLKAALPDTLKELTVTCLEHMASKGYIVVKWKEVSDYLNNVITGAQLASRVTKSP